MVDLEAVEKRQAASKAALKKEDSLLAGELKANSKAYSDISNQIERQTSLQGQANTRLVEGKTAYDELQQAAQRAGNILGVVTISTENVAAASASAAETIK